MSSTKKIIIDACVIINAFQIDSIFRDECKMFMDHITQRNISIVMPSHGWFEVFCTMKRIKYENKLHVGLINGIDEFKLELRYIDHEFIEKYGNINLPYQKGGDYIYTIIAYIDQLPLITTDKNMLNTSRSIGVNAYNPSEYLERLLT